MVTGSTRGIGRAVARELAAAGMNVVVNSSSGRSLPAAEAVAAEIAEEFGVETLAVAANVAIEEEANALIAAATEANGRVDVLVNNAGHHPRRPGRPHVRRRLRRRHRHQPEGHLPLLPRRREADDEAALGSHREHVQRGGRVRQRGPGELRRLQGRRHRLTKSLARELARRNITANAVAPGFIATDMTDALSDAQREAIVSRIGSGRLGEPDDIAHLVRFLASDEASYITGQVICVDGGMSL